MRLAWSATTHTTTHHHWPLLLYVYVARARLFFRLSTQSCNCAASYLTAAPWKEKQPPPQEEIIVVNIFPPREKNKTKQKIYIDCVRYIIITPMPTDVKKSTVFFFFFIKRWWVPLLTLFYYQFFSPIFFSLWGKRREDERNLHSRFCLRYVWRAPKTE